MLNPFPTVLFLSFFAPTILRITVGLFFLWFTHGHLIKNRVIARVALQDGMGRAGVGVIVGLGLLELLIGGFLIAGFLTQIAALVGMLLMLLFSFLRKQTGPVLVPPTVALCILLAVVCATLIITGAGALAFDLPL